MARTALLAFVAFFAALTASARVISYSPLTDKQAVPAVQERTNRYYVLIEYSPGGTPPIFAPIPTPAAGHQLVLYDSQGEAEPRVILAGETSSVYIGATAVREDANGVPWILTHTNASVDGDNPNRNRRLLLSRNAGATWTAVMTAEVPYTQPFFDKGGPVARGRGAAIRPGTDEFPFIATVQRSNNAVELAAIAGDGSAKTLGYFGAPAVAPPPPIGIPVPYYPSTAHVIGSNREASKYLVVGSALLPDQKLSEAVRVVRLDGTMREVVLLPTGDPGFEGWIAPDGTVYLDSRGYGGPHTLLTYRNGQRLDSIDLGAESLAVPTHDYSGAWIVRRGTGQPTILMKHSPGVAPVEMWRDDEGPQIEAIHAAESGERLLIQVHRPRPQADNRLFIDPALAVWEIGAAAPSSYDELFLNEGTLKGFVNLDVDAVAAGAPFVFDSAMTSTGGVIPPISPAPPGGGGGDVVQEWGVVKASLQQRLVIPSVARAPGAFGSLWRTDVVLYNPSVDPVSVELEFVPVSLDASHARLQTVQLAGREIRLLNDFLMKVFGLDSGSGALFLNPSFGSAITATSRTYSERPDGGTFGMGMPAIDVHAAASTRFTHTFAGAFQGSNFRTNVLVTDVSGRGSDVTFGVRPARSSPLDFTASFKAPRGGQTQIVDLESWMPQALSDGGAMAFRPTSGEAIASVVAMDNRTNDPSYFTPDLPAQSVRVIPALAHASGMNGAEFRSDLFLLNASASTMSVFLAAKLWDVPEGEVNASISMQPGEVRVIRDALFTLFGKTGVARLRYQSNSWADNSVRVTSRIYTVGADGATFGMVMPPINSFQSAGVDEALEVLGARGGAQFRTNLALVELSPFANQAQQARVRVEIFDPAGELFDSFETAVPGAGGIQLVDIFRNRGKGDGPEVSLIRVTTLAGRVAAFASNLDNVTNDSTYLSAVLASQE